MTHKTAHNLLTSCEHCNRLVSTPAPCQQPSGMTLQSMPCEPCISRLGGVIALQQPSHSVQLASSSLYSELSILICSMLNMRNYKSCDLPHIQYIHCSYSVYFMRETRNLSPCRGDSRCRKRDISLLLPSEIDK